MKRLLAAITISLGATAAHAASRWLPPPVPIGSNYLYFNGTDKALKYLAGGTISGTRANLTGVTAVAANVQPDYPILSGSLSGSGANQTMTLKLSILQTIPVGEQIVVGGGPSSWNETCTVTASSQGSVSCLNPNAVGAFSTANGPGVQWNNSSIPAIAHSHGMAAIDFDGGTCPTADCSARLAYQASVGVDAIMIDEAPGGQSGWPAVISYWKSQRPGGFFGMSGDTDVIAAYVNSGVQLDYAEVEWYVNSDNNNPFITNGLTAKSPNTKTIALFYGTGSLCNNYGTSFNPVTSFNTIGFWDVDGYGPFANTAYMDYNWLQNAQIYAETGSITSICNLAVSAFNFDTPSSGVHQSTSFTVTTTDYVPPSSPYTIKSCQYAVFAGANIVYGLDDPSAVQTVPWTNKPCYGSTGTITVGPGGNCNVNSVIDQAPANIGNETYTCAIAYRALMSNGQWGDEGYTLYRIK